MELQIANGGSVAVSAGWCEPFCKAHWAPQKTSMQIYNGRDCFLGRSKSASGQSADRREGWRGQVDAPITRRLTDMNGSAASFLMNT